MKKQYRFVVIRRPIAEEDSDQLTLFTMGKYSYAGHCDEFTDNGYISP
ncbi:hypothetical protein HKBW3S06_01661 [Candidatus Hakubella thermalkaliphila]|uniref:Uncharacterized protein n=1 Tax=Candidatus Hakubella thermalkaliphila TaxID=2754717 RepID=A0A6V8NQU1_9ACTN|nr:hypothetical protein HKBW3S06_01661 [Candidatus Hakubella thermalkaliphila]